MKLKSLKIQTANEVEEALTEYLVTELGAVGTEVRRRQDFIAAGERHQSELVELDLIEDLPADIEVIAYFNEDADLQLSMKEVQAKLAQLVSFGLAIGEGTISTGEIADQDWNTVWKNYYDVVQVTHDLTIVPEWIDYQPKHADEKIIRLDPGLSFGTGTHITTQLALLALEKIMLQPQTVLDLGTGSGILAIAAHKLGATKITATDIDEQALTASKTNLALNQIADVQLSESDLFSNVHGQYEIVIANILTEILLLLVPNLAEHLAPQGQVIMSGIDIEQLPKLTAKLSEYGFEIKLQMQQERWVALIVVKKEED